MNTPKHAPVAPFPSKPIHLPAVFSTAGTALELFTFTRNLKANLAAVISAAVARSADPASAAAALGVSVRQLHRAAAHYNVRLPWGVKVGK